MDGRPSPGHIYQDWSLDRFFASPGLKERPIDDTLLLTPKLVIKPSRHSAVVSAWYRNIPILLSIPHFRGCNAQSRHRLCRSSTEDSHRLATCNCMPICWFTRYILWGAFRSKPSLLSTAYLGRSQSHQPLVLSSSLRHGQDYILLVASRTLTRMWRTR